MQRMAVFLIGVCGLTWAGAGLAQESNRVVRLDDCEAPDIRNGLWRVTGAVAEFSTQQVGSGQGCLKVAFSNEAGELAAGRPDQPFDWGHYQTLRFSVFNSGGLVSLRLRLDDAQSEGPADRYETSYGLFLPPGAASWVEISLTNLLANNGRPLDICRLAHFGVHPVPPAVLFFDEFQLIPLPKEEWREPEIVAAQPLRLAGGENAELTMSRWSASNAVVEVSAEHAAEGSSSLKIRSAKTAEPAAVALQGVDGKPMDWRGYRSFCFNVLNPAVKPCQLSVRIEDGSSRSYDTRFQVDNIGLAPGTVTPVRIDIWTIQSPKNFRIDKSKIARAVLCFPADTAAVERVVFLDNVRLDVAGGGLQNARQRRGRLPDQTPATLGKALLEDPQIKPLIPLFQKLPAMRIAVCAHSASMNEHWSTSGGLIQIALEAMRAVNPRIEYKEWCQGGLNAGGAVKQFLKPMQEYKPTHAFLLVVPLSPADLKKLIGGLKVAGSAVFVLDPVKPWGGGWYLKHLPLPAWRELCREQGAPFLELQPLGYGAPGAQDWLADDGVHMTTQGHIFYAKQLLLALAPILSKPAVAAPGSD
jgi:hypothetical protein